MRAKPRGPAARSLLSLSGACNAGNPSPHSSRGTVVGPGSPRRPATRRTIPCVSTRSTPCPSVASSALPSTDAVTPVAARRTASAYVHALRRGQVSAAGNAHDAALECHSTHHAAFAIDNEHAAIGLSGDRSHPRQVRVPIGAGDTPTPSRQRADRPAGPECQQPAMLRVGYDDRPIRAHHHARRARLAARAGPPSPV
jgi:hypothetical protein